MDDDWKNILSRKNRVNLYCDEEVNDKALDQITAKSRKRKRNGNHNLFEIRSSCQNDGSSGMGMFSSTDICCGDIIVANEKPLVASLNKASMINFRDLVCHACGTPMHTLRQHISHNNSANNVEFLPLLETDDFTFTRENGDQRQGEKYFQNQYCSSCNDDPLISLSQMFLSMTPNNETDLSPDQNQYDYCECALNYDNSGWALLFLLAGKAVSITLASIYLMERSSSISHSLNQKDPGVASLKEKMSNYKDFQWWNEYVHPLWWEIDNDHQHNQKKRKESERMHQILSKTLGQSIQNWKKHHDLVPHEKKLSLKMQLEIRNILLETISKLFTLETFGKILGMLQCNVMESRVTSPKKQYISFIQGLHEDFTILQKSHIQSCDDENGSKKSEEIDNLGIEGTVPSWILQSHDDSNDGHDIVALGLYPILTMANHDCNPNASIEFISSNESNFGSMVAIRDIPQGEEITITYVPNGDYNSKNNDEGNFFKNFPSSRTWTYLKSQLDNSDEEDDCCSNSSSECEGVKPGENEEDILDDFGDPVDHYSGDVEDKSDNCNIKCDLEDTTEGTNYIDRQKSISEYGFVCRCQRCKDEDENVKNTSGS